MERKYIDTRLAAYQKLEDEVETCFNKVIPERQDAYFQLVNTLCRHQRK